MPEIVFPAPARDRGPGFWLNPANLIASRRKLRADHSNEWRYAFEAEHPPSVARSTPFEDLLAGRDAAAFSFAILGDTGEGDRSQYALVPLLRALAPDFLLINGDVAYPAGEFDDFLAGLFRPYNGLNVPIWATAGNHEYYSKGNGRVFYDLFCSRKHAATWTEHGLRHVPMPGMYWELRDPARRTPLVVIGLDSGTKGNLDGRDGKRPDVRQHEWLDWRLRLADERGDKVMVLFHIPGLVSGAHEAKVYIGEVHRILARHRSVRAVVCGHIHNHQVYDPATFADYTVRAHGALPPAHTPPHYVVSGNGGATLDGTTFGNGGYPCAAVYPSSQQWRDHAGAVTRAMNRGFRGWVLTRLAGKIAAVLDVDPPNLVSFLHVTVQAGGQVDVAHVFVDDLPTLFDPALGDQPVRVDAPNPPLAPNWRARAVHSLFPL